VPLDPRVAAYLRERMRRADTVLFTGAGFSRGARNRAGAPVPLGKDLKQILWALCYPTSAFDDNSKLEDLYQIAKSRNPSGLVAALRTHLSIEPDSMPGYYATLLSLPWYSAYTLNVDDLAVAVARKHALRRHISPVSALGWAHRPVVEASDQVLPLIHLNGLLDEAPEGITFSPTQYAERLAGQEPLYAQCAAEVLSHPVIFIGTPLDESPLWQHVQMRRRGSRTRREFRRQSFIVTPSLDQPRIELLEREFHVTHIPMGVDEFATELLGAVQDVIDEGYAALGATSRAAAELREPPLAQDLASASPVGSSDYLLGRSPNWADVRDGFAAERTADRVLAALVTEDLQREPHERSVIFVAGTAGSGKSSSILRLALSVTARGTNVAWVDSTVDISPLNLRRSMERDDHPPLLVLDDADRYGSELPALVDELSRSRPRPVVVIAMRSGRGAERFLDRALQLGVSVKEFDMPNLTDDDVRALLDVLDTHNRLGVLKGKTRGDQVAAFRESAGRQLIVALLEATSGRKFEELIVSEMQELSDDTRDLYAIAAVASALRFGLTRDELLLAVDDRSAATLASIDALQRRHLLVPSPSGELKVRHRTIADVLMKALAEDGRLADVVSGLAIAAASKVGPATRRNHKHFRRLRSLINHDWLTHSIGLRGAKELFEELEPFLNWDHHYWLQRGSFELEHGDLQLAENFLNQAYSLEPDDGLVKTEYGYLQLRLAVHEPSSGESRRLLEEGFDLLREAIASRNGTDPHQYHILGRQGLEWLRRGDVSPAERRQLLDELLGLVEAGRRDHPRDERLRQLLVDVQNARLGV
jgi:hypothetical protein